MNRFASRLKPMLYLILLFAALLGYLLPWAVARAAPMTLGAYDLAEWVSLHPSQLHTSPPLQAALLLRVQLAVVSVMLAAASANQRWRLASAAVIVLLAVGQLPPPEYVKDPGNLNYGQQFALALFSLAAGLILLRVRHAGALSAILVIAALAGILSAQAGLSQAYDVYILLLPGGKIGLGPWILFASYAFCFMLAVSMYIKGRRSQS